MRDDITFPLTSLDYGWYPGQMAGTVRYREFHTLRWLTWSLGGISVVVLVYSILEGAPLGGWLVLGGFVGFFVAQFPRSHPSLQQDHAH